MARHKDDSLKYYNQDTRDDDNLQYIEAEHGFAGYAIVHKLWKHIYGNPCGYFCPWDEINKKLFCKNNGIGLDDLNKIMETCFQPGIEIFNKDMVANHRILTSKGVQKRWLKIVKECGRTRSKIDEKYNLLPVAAIQQIEKDAENTPAVLLTGSLQHKNNSGGALNLSESTQRKGKEIKEKEIKLELGGMGPHAPDDFLNQKGEKENTGEKGMPGAEFIPPEWRVVSDYFFNSCKNYWDPVKCRKVARKFYDHFKSQNWKTSADAQITDWKARAEKWILEDLEAARSVPREQNTQSAAIQSDEKTKNFIQEVYQQFCNGGVKPESIPADIYNFLIREQVFELSTDEKTNYMQRCNNDEVKAKKLALLDFFEKQKYSGAENIFSVNN